MPGHVKRICFETGLRLSKNVQQKAAGEQMKEVGKVFSMFVKSKKNSVEQRVLRSVLLSLVSPATLNEYIQKHGGKEMASKTIRKAAGDTEVLLNGYQLTKVQYSRQYFSVGILKFAVRFILQAQYIVPLSWGWKKVKLSRKETVKLPRLVRKITRANLLKEYIKYCKHEGVEMLSVRSFEKVVDAVTSGQQHALNAVDDLTDTLVNQPYNQMKRVITLAVTGVERKKKLLLMLSLVKNFLKVQFDKHVGDDSQITHNVHHALDKGYRHPGRLQATCTACKFVPYFYDELRQAIEDSNGANVGDAIDVVNDCEAKAHLYQGHRIRVANQNNVLDGISTRLREDCASLRLTAPKEVLIIADFKMKFLPKEFREATLRHFGKRGISWHGFCVMYFVYNPETEKAEPRVMYCDQIVDGTNKQDGVAVASLVGKFLCQLKKELPTVESYILQTDNARYYHSKTLLMLLPLVSQKAGIPITRYIHTETQDGKCLIDAHFAKGEQHVDSYIVEGEDALNSMQVGIALASHGGIPNSFVQVVRMNASKSKTTANLFKQVIKNSKKALTRKNDIFFETDLDRVQIQDTIEEIMDKFDHDVTFRTRTYSGIGTMPVYTLKLKSNTFTLASEQTENNEDEDESEDDEDKSEDDEENDESDGASSYEAEGAQGDENENNDGNNADVALSSAGDMVAGSEADMFGNRVVFLNPICIQSTSNLLSREDADADDEEIRAEESDSDGDEGDLVVMRKDLGAAAVRIAADLIETGDIEAFVRDGRAEQKEYLLARDYELDLARYKAGWAVRPARGETRGETYLSDFRDDIREMFEQGEKDSGAKMQPSWMVERLRAKYPGRIKLPSENTIRGEITRLLQVANAGKVSKRSKMSQEQVDYLYELAVEQSMTAKPAVTAFRDRFGHGEGLPTDDQVRNKINVLRTAAKSN
uniref:Uncharacterized protein n=1 Tax=Mucochytrium quahogii TaxID=96639 RepID=A0A7S2SF11_9STRA|mmetsp:Transcript_6815/g.12058  ORF Transcript_6815/g.12058 Transcript_6815/m.12058 type:complete len:932 (-) Transcript_6815:801-3596(-)